MLKSNTRRDSWVNNNRITFPLWRATGKQPWVQKFPAEEQKWSPETHALNFRHDNNNKKKKSTDLMMLSPARQAREKRAGAERSPFLRQSRLLWRAEADQQSTLGGAQTRTGPVIGPAQAAGSSAGGNTHPRLGRDALLWFRWKWGGERGKEGGESVPAWLTDLGSGWRSCVKSVFWTF